MTSLIDAMERIYAIEQQRVNWGKWFCGLFTSFFAKLSKLPKMFKKADGVNRRKAGLSRRFCNLLYFVEILHVLMQLLSFSDLYQPPASTPSPFVPEGSASRSEYDTNTCFS